MINNMIKKALAIAALCSALAANADGGVAVIRGKSSVIPDSTDITLFQMIGSSGSAVADTLVMGGQFAFELPVDTGLTVLHLSLFAKGREFAPMSRELYVRPGAQVEVDADNHYIKTWPVKSNVPEQAEYDGIIFHNQELWERMAQLYIDNPRGTDEGKTIGRDLRKRETEYLSGRPLTDLEFEYLAGIAHDLGYYGGYRDELLTLYESLPSDQKQSYKGKIIHSYLFPPTIVGVGDPVPDLPMYDLDGNEHHFAELLGKWVLVDLWSSGCGPCIQGIPEIKKVEEKYRGDVVVLSLSLDVDRKWREATEKFNVTGNNWNEGLEQTGLYQRVDAQGMPTYVVISPEGKIVYTWCGYGPGVILARTAFAMLNSGKTERSEADGVITVAYPKYKDNNTDCLVVKNIEMSGNATVLNFDFITMPNTWIKIAPEARLVGPDGAECRIIDSEGIVPGQELWADGEGRGSFSLSFEPFKEAIDTFDFYEDYDPDGWHITGIKL